jgi:hypothetical protein
VDWLDLAGVNQIDPASPRFQLTLADQFGPVTLSEPDSTEAFPAGEALAGSCQAPTGAGAGAAAVYVGPAKTLQPGQAYGGLDLCWRVAGSPEQHLRLVWYAAGKPGPSGVARPIFVPLPLSLA